MLKKLLSLFIMAVFGLMAVRPVYAIPPVSGYFSDQETSTGNIFSATTLDFSLRDTSDTFLVLPLFNITGMIPGNSETKPVRVKKDGLLDFKYQLSAAQTGGDAGLCTALQVEAKLDGVTQYSGNLLGLTLISLPTVSAGQDDWTYAVSLTDGSSALQNKTCLFDLKIRGWQTDSNGTWGFGDEETLTNSVTSGIWDAPGSVVINELMWMGSTDSGADEWIELKNTTGSDINLAGWIIENAGESGAAVTLSGTIGAHGYFLLSNYATNASAVSDSISADLMTTAVSLLDGGEQLTLKSNLNVTIDQTPTGVWAAGVDGANKQSMERNDTPSTGWHTCTDSACNDTTYWDAEGNNYGTPKAANLSENDPSSPAYVAPVVPVEPTPIPTPTPAATAIPELNSELSASPSATTIEPTPTPEEEITP